MERVIIGIDPGASGGIAVLDMCGGVAVAAKMPETPRDILEFLRGYSANSCCYMEDVGHGMPGQSSRATATFARHCGHLEMALMALGIPTHTVTPNKWMKTYQLGKSSDYEKREWKRRLKEKAQQLFPDIRMTYALCDALLIAEYGRQHELKA